MFSGEADSFELWRLNVKGLIRINKLHSILDSTDPNVNADKNTEIFALMVQYLDDKSLNLIIRYVPDMVREAFKILQKCYLDASKPRIITYRVYRAHFPEDECKWKCHWVYVERWNGTK